MSFERCSHSTMSSHALAFHWWWNLNNSSSRFQQQVHQDLSRLGQVVAIPWLLSTLKVEIAGAAWIAQAQVPAPSAEQKQKVPIPAKSGKPNRFCAGRTTNIKVHTGSQLRSPALRVTRGPKSQRTTMTLCRFLWPPNGNRSHLVISMAPCQCQP